MLYGVTHTLEGQPIIRLPKACKVGIGNPKGKAIHVWIERSAKTGKLYWRVETGYGKEAAVEAFENRKDAETFYGEKSKTVGDCPFPRRLPYFTFLKPMPDGTFAHDFDAIERHGAKPTAIDIVFLANEPFKSAFQMWSASELKCIGDGRNAQRVLSMATTEEEKRLAAEAKAAGAKMFPIVDSCFLAGCQYTKETTDSRGKVQPPPCKIGTDLEFQLANDLRVGAKAFLHSTGFRTTTYLFSSLESVKMLTGGHLMGVPMKLVVRPFKAVHNGQPSTQYAIAVEFRAEDIDAIKRKLIAQAFEFRQLAGAPVDMDPMQDTKMLTAAADDEEDENFTPSHITAEFYPGAVTDEDEPSPSTPSAQAAEATEKASESLKDKLKEQQAQKATEPSPAAEKPKDADPAPVAEPPKRTRKMPFD